MAKRGRPKKVDNQTLIKLADRYFYEELSESGGRLTVAGFARYCCANGHKIADNTLIQNKELMAHLDSLKKTRPGYVDENARPIVYTPIDADALLQNNRDPQMLKKAIIARDQYYKDISDSAAIYLNKAVDAESKCKRLSKELDSLKSEKADQARYISDLREQIKTLDANYKACKAVIDKYIDPAIATTLLKKMGAVSSKTTTIVNEEAVNESIVTGGTKITSHVLQDMFNSVSNKGEKNHE